MSAQLKNLLDRLDDLANNMGSAIYDDAETCGEAAAELRRLHALNVELLEIAKSVEGMVSNCDVSSGVCCCGDSMEKHPDPMYCGHSPVDSGVYAANSLLKKARAAIEAKLREKNA